jgi:hypothetical protein
MGAIQLIILIAFVSYVVVLLVRWSNERAAERQAWWLGWATPADLQRAIGVPVGVGVCIALLLLPDHWQRWFDHFLGFAIKCVLWTIALAAGLVMVALAMWRLSDINFGAPLTLGGAIIIAMIIVVSRT